MTPSRLAPIGALACALFCGAPSTPTYGQEGFACPIADSLRASYAEDIERLAVQRLYDVGSPDTAEVELPLELLDTLYGALAAVYALDLPERDSIFELYCLGNSGGFGTAGWVQYGDAITFWADPEVSWVERLRENEVPTGNTTVDSLLEGFGLRPDTTVTLSDGYVVLRTASPLHLGPIKRTLAEVDGVVNVEETFYYGDGNFYSFEVDEGESLLRFALRWGDCPSGCTDQRTWTFAVDSGCTARFVGAEFNDPVDWPLATAPTCRTSSLGRAVDPAPKGFSLSPNPASPSAEVLIAVSGPLDAAAVVSLRDALGRPVWSAALHSPTTSIPLDAISPGIYYVTLSDRRGSRTQPLLVR